jgi:hypothetical protein
MSSGLAPAHYYELADPGELFLPKHLPRKQIIQLTVRTVSNNLFGELRGHPGEANQLVNPGDIDVEFGARW